MIQAKLQVYFWLGSIKHKKNYPSGLPPGFQPTSELQNAERPAIAPPTTIHYSEKHVSMEFMGFIYYSTLHALNKYSLGWALFHQITLFLKPFFFCL